MFPENRNLTFTNFTRSTVDNLDYKMIGLMLTRHACQNLNLGITMKFFQFNGPCLIYFWNLSFRNSLIVLLQTRWNKKTHYSYFIIECNKEKSSKLTTCLISNIWLFLNTAAKNEDLSLSRIFKVTCSRLRANQGLKKSYKPMASQRAITHLDV